MIKQTYWGSIISRWFPWLQPKEKTEALAKGSSSYPLFTGSRSALERYLGPTLHNLVEEASNQYPRRCWLCKSGNIDPASRKAVDAKVVIASALEFHEQGDTYFVNLEQLEQHINELYREQVEASSVLCKDCLKKRQVSKVRESYKFPDLSVYKTPELKLGPNLTSTGRTESSIKDTSGKGSKKLRYTASEFRALQEMKIGELVQKTFPRLLENNILSESTILELQDPLRSKKIFDVNFPVLKKLNSHPTPEIWKDAKGYPRYYSRPLKWKNSKYIFTSQWYRDTHALYLKWLRNFIVVSEE